ncbi:hypothetical protein F4678DRAFT_469176 [Xylaria arbuscula]|nr:hypothetical protein F4678DRAFT_469176 [Xylaria arbuscula]
MTCLSPCLLACLPACLPAYLQGFPDLLRNIVLASDYQVIGKAKNTEPPLDGRIEPNHCLAPGTEATNFNNHPTSAAVSANVSANNNLNTNPRSTNDDAARLDCFFGPFGGHDLHNLYLGGSIPSGCPFPPLPSPPASDWFPPPSGDTLSQPFYTPPNTTNIPLIHIGGVCHDVPFAPILQPPLPIPPALAHPPSRTVPPPAPVATAPASQTHPTYFAPPQCFVPPTSRCNFYGPPRIYQPPSFQNIYGGGIRNPFVTASPLSAFATTPTALSHPHMSNVNPRLTPPVYQAQCYPRAAGATRSVDDPFLAALVSEDFSSPSLPPLSNSPSPTILSPAGRSGLAASGQAMPQSSTRRRIPNRGGAVDLTKQEPDSEPPSSGVDPSIPLATMPPATRRRSAANVTDSGARKRPSVSTTPTNRPSKTRRKEPPGHRDDQSSPFEDDEFPGLNGHDGSETIDLSNATEVPAELMAPKVDNRVKLGKFQCVICMDDTKELTVTHCGHLFCSGCLHSSLHIDSMKRTCPVCRTKIDLKATKKSTKSYYHLELKVMTATKQGKRPAGT